LVKHEVLNQNDFLSYTNITSIEELKYDKNHF